MLLRRTHARSGFTMIELLMVILILALLAALLLTGINKVLVYTEEVRSTADINQLSQSCESFKMRFGRYPAARIMLIENPTATAYDNYSANYLTSMFPGITLGIYDTTQQAGIGWHDWNGNGIPDQRPFILIGSEALTYFLGGIPAANGNGFTGFCTDKTRPTLATPGRNREGPFYEFNAGRLAAGRYPNIPLGYNDYYGTPFAYFLARDTSTNNYPSPVLVPPVDHDCYDTATMFTLPGMRREFVPYWTNVTGSQASPAFRFHRPDKFQIISAGKDRQFGGGGHYDEVDSQSSRWNTLLTALDANADGYFDDMDNLSSFTEGRMVRK